jgi:DNA-binding LytR/AlgR family response regulator
MLLDIAMPGMDGLRLARQLRRTTRFRDTVLVAITGYADEGHFRLCEGAFDYYLIKPVEPTTLQKLLMKERELRAWLPADMGGADGAGREDEPARRRVRAHPPGSAAPSVGGEEQYGWPTFLELKRLQWERHRVAVDETATRLGRRGLHTAERS